MGKIILIFLLFSHHLIAQIPDYSNLTKKEKLFFLNGYGYIKMVNGDTIYGVVKGYQNKDDLDIYEINKIKIDYPRKLEKYKYLKEIPLSKVDMYYSVGYRTFKYVKNVNGKNIILTMIVDGNIKVYQRIIMRFDLALVYLGAKQRLKETYFEDEKGKLFLIIGKDKYGDVISKQRIKYNFIDFFRGKYDKAILEKVKPRERKIIEFVEKYNDEKNLSP